MRKFECIKNRYYAGDKIFTKGKIYPEKDGYIVDNDGDELRLKYCGEAFKDCLVEIKEPKPIKHKCYLSKVIDGVVVFTCGKHYEYTGMDASKTCHIYKDNSGRYRYLSAGETFSTFPQYQLYFRYTGRPSIFDNFFDTVEAAEYAIRNAMSLKPPLGLKPRKIHNENRIKEIQGAMRRYNKAGKLTPEEWLDELEDLLNE